MVSVRPFETWLIKPESAHEVVTPAYDSLTPAQRHEYASAHPHSYFNCMRSVDEFPAGERPGVEELLRRNRAALNGLLDEGFFERHPEPAYYLYRLAADDHVQTGIVGEVSIGQYDTAALRRHEHTHAEKERAMTRYRDVVGAASSPVSVAYPADDELDALMSRVAAGRPLLDFALDDGVRQSVWIVSDPEDVRVVSSRFERIPALYLTDGHHRAAAARHLAERRRQQNPEHGGEESYNFLLVALFPSRDLRILPYHRCVKDLNGLDVPALLRRLTDDFEVEELVVGSLDDAAPRERGEFSMYTAGQWYRLKLHADRVPDDPVSSLDVSVLHERVLGPVLGVRDPRSDPRVDYVPGAMGLAGLVARVEQGWAAAFAVHPTDIHDLMRIADTGQVMPPKSTWFDPKVRSGIFLRQR